MSEEYPKGGNMGEKVPPLNWEDTDSVFKHRHSRLGVQEDTRQEVEDVLLPRIDFLKRYIINPSTERFVSFKETDLLEIINNIIDSLRDEFGIDDPDVVVIDQNEECEAGTLNWHVWFLRDMQSRLEEIQNDTRPNTVKAQEELDWLKTAVAADLPNRAVLDQIDRTPSNILIWN